MTGHPTKSLLIFQKNFLLFVLHYMCFLCITIQCNSPHDCILTSKVNLVQCGNILKQLQFQSHNTLLHANAILCYVSDKHQWFQCS